MLAWIINPSVFLACAPGLIALGILTLDTDLPDSSALGFLREWGGLADHSLGSSGSWRSRRWCLVLEHH